MFHFGQKHMVVHVFALSAGGEDMYCWDMRLNGKFVGNMRVGTVEALARNISGNAAHNFNGRYPAEKFPIEFRVSIPRDANDVKFSRALTDSEMHTFMTTLQQLNEPLRANNRPVLPVSLKP